MSIDTIPRIGITPIILKLWGFFFEVCTVSPEGSQYPSEMR